MTSAEVHCWFCGELIGSFNQELKYGEVVYGDMFTRVDGSHPADGTLMEEVCPCCGENVVLSEDTIKIS